MYLQKCPSKSKITMFTHVMYAPLNQTLVSKSLKYVNTIIPSKSLHIRLRLEKLQLHNILKRWKTKTDMTFTGLSKMFEKKLYN